MIPFFYTNYKISNNIELSVIDIEKIDKQFKSILDENFVSICEGNSDSNLALTKKYVNDLYINKNEQWKLGATAEFFIHLYIKLLGFKQECLFLNLEEKASKKGFDGYYSHNGIEWIMESKSGLANKKNSHVSKVKEAIKDLENKVTGFHHPNKKLPNNPWHNAYNHANLYDVGTAKEIQKNIKQLSNDFTNGIYHSVDKFNTMPCGTIFLSGNWNPFNHKDIFTKIKEISNKLKGNQVHVICVTQKSVEIFHQYLKLEG